MPEDTTNSMFALCFARIEATSGTTTDARVRFAHTEATSGTTIDARGFYKLNVCIAFYTCRSDLRRP